MKERNADITRRYIRGEILRRNFIGQCLKSVQSNELLELGSPSSPNEKSVFDGSEIL